MKPQNLPTIKQLGMNKPLKFHQVLVMEQKDAPEKNVLTLKLKK